jgi:uncharacterized protein YciI
LSEGALCAQAGLNNQTLPQTPPTVPHGGDLFFVRGMDGPDARRLRAELMGAHLDFVETHWKRIRLAAPVLGADGGLIGSMFILQGESLAEARAFLDAEPYVAAGVYARIEAQTIRAALGTWIGGKIWTDGDYR